MTAEAALVHLRVPAALKGRWVRASRAKGMRLTDWIIGRVEGGGAITAAQFDAISLLLGGDTDSASRQAARSVMIDGQSQSGAARDNGISQPAVSKTVARYRSVHSLITGAWS